MDARPARGLRSGVSGAPGSRGVDKPTAATGEGDGPPDADTPAFSQGSVRAGMNPAALSCDPRSAISYLWKIGR
jgi:hypothetical protein